MTIRYNYTIAKFKDNFSYFSSEYTDIRGVYHPAKFTTLEEATICSTYDEAKLLLSAAEKYSLNVDYTNAAVIKKLPYKQKTFRKLTLRELEQIGYGAVIFASCLNRITKEATYFKNYVEICIQYLNDEEKNKIYKRLHTFLHTQRYFGIPVKCTAFELNIISEDTENKILKLQISPNKQYTFRNTSIQFYLNYYLPESIYNNVCENAVDVFNNLIFKFDPKINTYKQEQYPVIMEETENKIETNVVSNLKRKYNLPKYVCWDVRNTVMANKVWFGVTLTKNGKKTNTAAKTVKEAMEYVVNNKLNEKIWTKEQAEEYLKTYDPEMEKGYSVERAKEISKISSASNNSTATNNMTNKAKNKLYYLPKYISYDKAESRNRERNVFQTQLRINGKLYKNNLYTVKDALIYNIKNMLEHTDVWSLDKIADYIKTYDPEMENGKFIPSNTPKSPSVRKREKAKNIKQIKEAVNEKLKDLLKFAKDNDININVNVE